MVIRDCESRHSSNSSWPEHVRRPFSRGVTLPQVTVLAADSPLGRSIVAEASSRALRVTAVVIDPARWSAQVQAEVVRGDLLDLACPERLIDDSDVVVVPFGSSDSGAVDFGTDLHAATMLCRASERLALMTAQLVLAGRARRTFDAAHNEGLAGHLLEEGARQLADHAAVAMYAIHAQFQWAYTSPSGHVRSSDVRGRVDRLFDIVQQPSADASAPNLSTYITAIVDVIERDGDVARRHARTSFTGCGFHTVTSAGSPATGRP